MKKVAWRLLNKSGQAHILRLLEPYGPNSSMEPSLEPFHATAADAYCYHVALGLTLGIGALRVMAPVDATHGNFDSRFKTSFDNLKSAVGKDLSAFENASLEAYLMSPLMGKRPKLARIYTAKRPKVAEGSCSSVVSAMDLDPVVEPTANAEPQHASNMDVEPVIELAADMPEPQGCVAAALEATPAVEAQDGVSVAAEADSVGVNEAQIRLGGVPRPCGKLRQVYRHPAVHEG